MLKRNLDGDYINNNNVIVNKVLAKWNETSSILYPLYEYYSEKRVKQLSEEGKLDTSFCVKSDVGVNEPNIYKINSEEEQFLSILVVNGEPNKIFFVELLDNNNKIIASS